MKWRDWQLLIIFILLFYIAVSLTIIIARQPSTEPENTAVSPTGTLRPTLASSPENPVATTAPPTDTVQPTAAPVTPPTNTATYVPSPTASQTPTASPEPQPTATPTLGTITHTVQQGENLILIAVRYGTTVQAIVNANGLANPDVIYVGQRLVIPLPTQPPPTATASG